MSEYFDDLEIRSQDARETALAQALPAQIARAQALPGYGDTLKGIDAASVIRVSDLARLPVLRKSDLGRAQSGAAPFGGLTSLPGSRRRWCFLVVPHRYRS